MTAPTHPQQPQRLAALADYDILDTAPEKAFDDVVNLLARICEAPVALISLVDENRQWFKARCGLDASETPIGQSICAHAILGEDLLEIEDTLDDPRSAINPLCQGDEGFRFYAGAPLRDIDGLPIGSLCVLDYVPRRLSDLQRQTLKVLADQVMAQLDLRRALNTAETLKREIDHRVKNSLQSLSAVARFEARRASSDEAKAAMERMGRRIGSVAVVHEQLYLTGAEQMVALDAYLGNLADHMARIAPEGVRVTGAAERVFVTSRDAAMIGTLFNETAANAFKHAFPDGRPGQITYGAERLPDGFLRFTCEDDGIGLPPDIDVEGHGLGTILGSVLEQELGGRLSVENLSAGVRMVLEFEPTAGD